MSTHVASFSFHHGLGDAANFAHALPLWTRRGYEVKVSCSADKAPMFKAAGAVLVDAGKHHHGYGHPPGQHVGMSNDWCENKTAWNLTANPMPFIGQVGELWPELLGVNLHLPDPDNTDELDAFLADLGGKPILVHTRANTSPGEKNLNDGQEKELYRELLAQTDCPLVLLDWDNRVSRYGHYRMRHMLDDFGRGFNLGELAYLMNRSALVIGVDSGPLHFARFTDCPALGIWFRHQPAKFALPRDRTLHVAESSGWNSVRRHSFRIADVERMTGERIAGFAARLVAGERPADIVLSNVLSKLNTHAEDLYHDRYRTFGAALSVLKKKKAPRIVETGCARKADDWTAGFSTYVFGMFLANHGAGSLNSVDISPDNCRIAREWSEPFRGFVHVHEGDSLAYLDAHQGGADLVFLDSLDTWEPGCADHGLEEAKRAVRMLGKDGLILIDDSARLPGGGFRGKGEKAIPWLVANGWRIKTAGYQVLLERGTAVSKQR